MSDIAFPGPSRAAAESGTPHAVAAPQPPGPKTGRRWSDGAGAHAPGDPDAAWSMSEQWPDLVAALSEQAVESSNLLLRALNYLVGAGRLRRSEAKALSDAMYQLRGTSLRAQQITRLAGGRIRQARERVELADVIRHVLEERADEFAAAGVAVTSQLQPVDVLLDPPVAISLLNSLLDWAASFGGQLHLVLLPAAFPGPAQLQLRVATPAPAAASHAQGTAWTAPPRRRRLNDGLHWMLLRQIAASSSLEVERSREDGAAVVRIEFPNTFLSTDGLACLELTTGTPGSAAPQRESWVLVLAREDSVRAGALEALRRMGIAAQAADGADQARMLSAAGAPGVLVAAWDVPREEVDASRQLAGGDERCPLVEITPDLPSFHLSGFDRFETPKVGRGQIAAELPPTVLFELVKI